MAMRLTRFTKAAILGAAIALAGAATMFLPLAQELEENVGLDWLFTWRGPQPVPADVVVVTIEKSSSDKMQVPNRPSRWSRSIHARLVERLTLAEASVIGFDIIFKEQRDREGDRAFVSAIERAGNVVLFQSLDKEILHSGDSDISLERLVDPFPALTRAAAARAPFPLPKVPVKISQVWAFKTAAGDAPTLPIVMFQLHALRAYSELRRTLLTLRPKLDLPDVDEIKKTSSIVAAMRRIRELFKSDPSIASELSTVRENSTDNTNDEHLSILTRLYNSSDSLYLNYYGPPRSVITIPYDQALGVNGEPLPNLRGKAVFVGFAESRQPEQKDGFYTVYSLASGLDISGVEIAATAFANLLDGSVLKSLSLATQVAVVLVWGFVIGAVFRLTPAWLAVPGAVGGATLYLFIAQSQFTHSAIWLPIVVPILGQLPLGLFAAVFWRFLETQQERDHIRRAFGYYLPARVVDAIARNVGDMRVAGEVTYGVCMSTDAEQYATLAEQMHPRELGALMNDYYATLFGPVKSHGGLVSDVIGDAMLAIWTGTQPNDVLRRQACLAALEIQRDVETFNTARHCKLATRIGLHTGEVLLGNVGAMGRYEYRAVGDIVNTATRIQELNKHLKTRILASAESLIAIDGFVSRDLGMFLLAGKTQPTCIYELFSVPERDRNDRLAFTTEFLEALYIFKRGQWERAKGEFMQLQRRFPGDGPTSFYLNLCQDYLSRPPPCELSSVVSVSKLGVVHP